jgi:hypothetical protein
MSKLSEATVHIIGGGVSGLIAALVLEQKGYHPILFEASSRVGGRVKTDIVEGHQLDHGFQVLLDSYPLARKYLDYDSLELQKLLPGAEIYDDGATSVIGDFTRHPSFLWSTLLSRVGSVGDKWKINQLRRRLRSKTIEEIFEADENTTMSYLMELGFSHKMIRRFFKPFFSGIFLETQLETSSRMFEFVYKMFGEGHATIPKAGMEAIPKQLLSKLQKTQIHYNTPVENVRNGEISIAGERVASDFTIVATDPFDLVQGMVGATRWKECYNLYFTTPATAHPRPLIGLNARENGIVNNIFYTTSVDVAHKGKDQLLSVTVIDTGGIGDQQLVDAVEQELIQDFGIHSTTFVHQFRIPRALPHLENIKYQIQPGETKVTERVSVAGDQLVHGSLNAAMAAGESAALAAIGTLEQPRES